VDDGRHGSSIRACIRPPATCQLVVFPHPRAGAIGNRHGALCTSDLLAMRYAYEILNAGFIVKLDSDSLVIGPFARAICDALSTRQSAGIIGTLGNSSNRDVCSFEANAVLQKLISEALSIAKSSDITSPPVRRRVSKWRIQTDEQVACFLQACQLFAPIADCAFNGSHCQGGGYAVSEAMLARCSETGFFADPSLWTSLWFDEDEMMGCICAAVGLGCLDFSGRGQVFGVQAIGLAYTPATLVQRGYSIIHSVKNDPCWPESDIREFFRRRRESASANRPVSNP
jgi:hypothetical protein